MFFKGEVWTVEESGGLQCVLGASVNWALSSFRLIVSLNLGPAQMAAVSQTGPDRVIFTTKSPN